MSSCSLSDLESFISEAEAGLGRRLEEGDYGGLVGVMAHLLAVKERQHSTDAMFEPLKQTIALLKLYEQELPDLVYRQLEVRTIHVLFFLSPSFLPFSALVTRHSFLPPFIVCLCVARCVCRSCQRSGTT